MNSGAAEREVAGNGRKTGVMKCVGAGKEEADTNDSGADCTAPESTTRRTEESHAGITYHTS